MIWKFTLHLAYCKNRLCQMIPTRGGFVCFGGKNAYTLRGEFRKAGLTSGTILRGKNGTRCAGSISRPRHVARALKQRSWGAPHVFSGGFFLTIANNRNQRKEENVRRLDQFRRTRGNHVASIWQHSLGKEQRKPQNGMALQSATLYDHSAEETWRY